jgi:hypothetical protein
MTTYCSVKCYFLGIIPRRHGLCMTQWNYINVQNEAQSRLTVTVSCKNELYTIIHTKHENTFKPECFRHKTVITEIRANRWSWTVYYFIFISFVVHLTTLSVAQVIV